MLILKPVSLLHVLEKFLYMKSRVPLKYGNNLLSEPDEALLQKVHHLEDCFVFFVVKFAYCDPIIAHCHVQLMFS